MAREHMLYYFNPLKLVKTCFVIQHVVLWVNVPCAFESLFASYSSSKRKDQLNWEQNGIFHEAGVREWSRLSCPLWLCCCLYVGGVRDSLSMYDWLQRCHDETGGNCSLQKEDYLIGSLLNVQIHSHSLGNCKNDENMIYWNFAF